MKMRIRFISFFIGGLFLFIIIMGLFVSFCMEFLIPQLFPAQIPSVSLELITLVIPFIVGGMFLGLFFVNPLLFIISLIQKLSVNEYDLSEVERKLYKKNGTLKIRYSLYRELITDINLLAQNLNSTEIQRRQLEEEKTNWIAGVSHDLKTPLSYITGYSSLLLNKDQTWSNIEQEMFLTEIHSKSKYITDMIGDLNLAFKMDSMSENLHLGLKPLNLIDFIRRLIADVANDPRASKYVLELDTNLSDTKILADQKLLYRGIQNILMNALLHNPLNTEIKVIITVDENVKNNIITIKDNGKGMSKDTLDHAFLRYYEVGTSEIGNDNSGLGLSLAKNIIEAHKGKIHMESILGKGTTAIITLLILV